MENLIKKIDESFHLKCSILDSRQRLKIIRNFRIGISEIIDFNSTFSIGLTVDGSHISNSDFESGIW